MYRLGMLLSGCGGLDGTHSIQAATAATAVLRRGGELVAMAPDVAQPTFDHRTGKREPSPRNALSEAARLVGGACRPISAVTAHHVDALFIPGGLGAVKTLCDVAVRGEEATVETETLRLLDALAELAKPIAALDEGTLLLAAARRGGGLELASGGDAVLTAAISALGHQPLEQDDPVVCAGTPVVTATSGPPLAFDVASRATEAVIDQLLQWWQTAESRRPGAASSG